ncbi:GerMN domain-containing protein [Ruminiclostridium herbifermentans]|uniref:GerMN domain-containing protein n=1 Tax=Ruminiclostridium herbifermentans TaxID=2488810 RepID=A0A4V6ENK1_9FIRM|nr:GerMN domain-containing protein [Ruminiclostridium herbifermentans]QNU67750.1 GerMN domain-containing protein [Ruminiclostridium herbifermentans]
MNKDKKLIVIVGVLFVFIIILVALLIYATNLYNKDDTTAVNTTISTNSNLNQTSDSTLVESQQSASETSSVDEKVDLQLYFYDADDYKKPKEIIIVSVDKKLYQDNITEAINKVFELTPLKINKAEVDGNLITVDLPKEVALMFNSGSAGGITYTNTLAMTLLNLPGIEELEVTVDGVKGVEADHFDFNGKFVKDESEFGFKFNKSDMLSKELEF